MEAAAWDNGKIGLFIENRKCVIISNPFNLKSHLWARPSIWHRKNQTYASTFACVEIYKNTYINSWSWHPALCQSAVNKELLVHHPCGLTGWTHSHSNPDWLEIRNNSLRETNHFILRNNSLASGRRLVYYSQYHPFHLGCFHSLIFLLLNHWETACDMNMEQNQSDSS